jgi:hypothetical protein
LRSFEEYPVTAFVRFFSESATWEPLRDLSIVTLVSDLSAGQAYSNKKALTAAGTDFSRKIAASDTLGNVGKEYYWSAGEDLARMTSDLFQLNDGHATVERIGNPSANRGRIGNPSYEGP